MAVIGFVLLVIAGAVMAPVMAPVMAQVPAPADRETWGNEQAKPTERTPPATRQSTPAQPRIAPPARAEDEIDALPSPGCQYRDNKLDLLV